jgi:hypothetical protein
VNGKINSADIYPSNGLFRKMWPKLLRASVTEAIGERTAEDAPAPPTAAVSGFIGSADHGRAVEAKAGERAKPWSWNPGPPMLRQQAGFIAIILPNDACGSAQANRRAKAGMSSCLVEAADIPQPYRAFWMKYFVSP